MIKFYNWLARKLLVPWQHLTGKGPGALAVVYSVLAGLIEIVLGVVLSVILGSPIVGILLMVIGVWIIYISLTAVSFLGNILDNHVGDTMPFPAGIVQQFLSNIQIFGWISLVLMIFGVIGGLAMAFVNLSFATLLIFDAGKKETIWSRAKSKLKEFRMPKLAPLPLGA